MAVFIMSIASSSKTKPGNAPRPGGKESRGLWASSGRLVLSLALYGGVPIERVGWMDGLEVLEVYLWVLAIVVHRAFFFIEVIGHEDADGDQRGRLLAVRLG